MDRGTYNFRIWCHTATGRIHYGPDRKKISKELMDHLEDHRDALMEQGMTQEEASEKVLEAMGSANSVAAQLAQVHKPFWGLLMRFSLIAMAVLLCLNAIAIGRYVKNLKLKDTPNLRKFDIYSTDSYGGDTGRQLLHLSKPGLSFTDDGHRFVITDAAIFTVQLEDGSQTAPQLYIRMRQTSWLPCQEQEQYFGVFSITSWFYARDSLGNEYPGYSNKAVPSAPKLNAHHVQSGIFTFTHELWINNFPADAQWVEICYEQDDRNHVLRVYLMGGVEE